MSPTCSTSLPSHGHFPHSLAHHTLLITHESPPRLVLTLPTLLSSRHPWLSKPCIFQHPVRDSSTPVVNGNVPQSGSTDISHIVLVSALHCVILSLVKTNPELSADSKDKIALQVLPDAHHPAICKFTFP